MASSRTKRFASLGPGALLLAAALSGGCSVLFHGEASQCTTSADCAARGSPFTAFTCDQGTCIAPVIMSGMDARVQPEAQAEAQVGPQTDARPMCTSNVDCVNFHPDPSHMEVACDVDTRQCIQLTSAECPLVIGNYSGTDGHVAPPIFLGAFLTIPSSSPTSHPSWLNYNVALNEFAVNGPGIPAGPGNGSRMPVAVGCSIDGTNGMIDTAWTHLLNDVHVQSIVAPLPAATLSHEFTTFASPGGIFVVNPLGADSTLTSLTTNGLLWHMLGQPSDNAPAYSAFLPLVEKYVRNTAPWSVGGTTPMRVATVTSNATVTNELASAVKKVLTWNGGQNVTQNSANYLQVDISDSTLNGTALTGMDPASAALLQSVSTAVQQILAFKPTVVISFASEEFNKLIENIEIDWPNSAPPFYLLGVYNQGSPNLQKDLNTNTFPFGVKRFAGIGIAATTNVQVLKDYQTRFLTAYPTRADALGEENFYDAMYFAVYSLIAAGRINAVGSDIASGMRRLISPNSTAYNIGPADMGSIFGALGAGGSIDLIGALGPPLFNTATGARIGEGDVYCVAHDVDGGFPFPYEYDVLRLANANGGAQPDGGSAYEGTFSCYPGIQ